MANLESDEVGADQNSQIVPIVGTIVSDPHSDACYNLYNSYAIQKGFSIRKGNIRYAVDGKITAVNYLCSREGLKVGSDVDTNEKKFEKSDMRTNCKARIRFKSSLDGWIVTFFDDEHNHLMANGNERKFLRSGRKISETQKEVLQKMSDSGVKTTQTYSYLAREAGGFENVGFTRRDCYNFINNERLNLIEPGDAQSLLDLFRKRQEDDPLFFYAHQVDQEGRLTNFFWRDGMSRIDYDVFGDVVVFDTTYRTNKYNMICAPFVGVNSHWRNMLFGCAFLLDETTASFVWLFETFLASMGGREPKSIFTDQDQAMSSAIAMVFETTRHRLCLWHISKNATKHLAHWLADPDFKKMFNTCLYGFLSESEFESHWAHLIDTYDLHDNRWLNHLHSIRHKWSPAFSLDIFSTGMKSSQRSESTNSVFTSMSKTTMRLTEFLLHYEDQKNKMRDTENEENFRSRHGTPPNANKGGPLLKQAASVYTRTMFQKFLKEWQGITELDICAEKNEGDICTFQFKEEGRSILFEVVIDTSRDYISCSCKKFEYLGILCRHALRGMFQKNLKKIPSEYILQRWTKSAKQIQLETTQGMTPSSWSSDLTHLSYLCIDLATKSPSMYEKFKSKLTDSLNDLTHEFDSLKMIENGGSQSDVEINLNSSIPVLDPIHIRPRGISNARLKSINEKLRKKLGSQALTSRGESSRGHNQSSSKRVCNRTSKTNEMSSMLPFETPHMSFTSTMSNNANFQGQADYTPQMLPMMSQYHAGNFLVPMQMSLGATPMIPPYAPWINYPQVHFQQHTQGFPPNDGSGNGEARE